MRKGVEDFRSGEAAARQLPLADYLRIKAASRELVRLAGGLEAAARVTRVGKSQLHEYGAVDREAFMPSDVVADLEAEIGRPVVSGLLAGMAADGSSPPAPAPLTAAEAIAAAGAMLTSAADFACHLSEAAGDGIITDAEAADAARACERLRATVDDVHRAIVRALGARREAGARRVRAVD